MSFTTLVDVATLAAHLDDPDWLIIDVRHQLADTAYGARVPYQYVFGEAKEGCPCIKADDNQTNN